MRNKTTCTIDQQVIIDIYNALNAGQENSKDLLDSHLEFLGEETKKNRSIANMYRTEISEYDRLLELLAPLMPF